MTSVVGIWNFLVGGGWKWLLAISLISFLAYFARDVYVDYQALIRSNTELTESVAELRSTNAVNEATIEEMERQSRENEINRQVLEATLQSAETRVDRLEDLLSDHDLEFLSLRRPGLIETRINNATEDAFTFVECITGGVCRE